MDFQKESCDASGMEKAEHAKRLRDAIATSRRYGRTDIEAATGKGYRTVSNWVSESKPMMPSDKDRATLRKMFPGYDEAGDPVEVAVRQSRLTEDRQYTVLGTYKRELRLQDEEERSAG